MKQNFQTLLNHVFQTEGGFVNDPRDPGGMTNHGVTKEVWEAFVGHSVDEDDMRALTSSDVAPVYKANYWDKVSGDALPDGVDYAVFDFAVNSGIKEAAMVLQQIVGVETDGSIGPKTLAALADHVPAEVVIKVCDTRQHFLEHLTTFAIYGHGWTTRIANVKALSIQMALHPSEAAVEPEVAQIDPLTEVPAVEETDLLG